MWGFGGEKGVKHNSFNSMVSMYSMVKSSFDKILDWLSSDDKDIEGIENITDDDLAEEDELFDDD